MADAISSIVLASVSPRRLELLRSLNLDVRVVPSSYEEPERPRLSPRELAIVHARHKCRDVVEHVRAAQSDVVVAADTVVDVNGVAYNKPSDTADAARMLRDLSGRTHMVHTAFTLYARGEYVESCQTTFVTFFDLGDDEIQEYVRSGEPMDKAGAYGIQGYGATLVDRIEGDFYTVMGFPLAAFVRTLRRLGFALPITKQSSTPI
jgi:septum formation protein